MLPAWSPRRPIIFDAVTFPAIFPPPFDRRNGVLKSPRDPFLGSDWPHNISHSFFPLFGRPRWRASRSKDGRLVLHEHPQRSLSTVRPNSTYSANSTLLSSFPLYSSIEPTCTSFFFHLQFVHGKPNLYRIFIALFSRVSSSANPTQLKPNARFSFEHFNKLSAFSMHVSSLSAVTCTVVVREVAGNDGQYKNPLKMMKIDQKISKIAQNSELRATDPSNLDFFLTTRWREN